MTCTRSLLLAYKYSTATNAPILPPQPTTTRRHTLHVHSASRSLLRWQSMPNEIYRGKNAVCFGIKTRVNLAALTVTTSAMQNVPLWTPLTLQRSGLLLLITHTLLFLRCPTLNWACCCARFYSERRVSVAGVSGSTSRRCCAARQRSRFSR